MSPNYALQLDEAVGKDLAALRLKEWTLAVQIFVQGILVERATTT